MRDWGRECSCPSGVDNLCGHRFDGQFGELPKGYDHKYVYSHFGYNLKATDMQAAIGCAQLDKIDGFAKRRRENFDYLTAQLQDLSDKLILPKACENSNPSWFGYLITCTEAVNRNQVVEYLEAHGVEIRNNMYRLRKRYKDVTPDEARKLLAELGVEDAETQTQPVEETASEQQMIVAEVENRSDSLTEPSENSGQLTEPVKPAGVMLHVHALSGEWFRYTRTVDGGIYIEPNASCIATDVTNVEAICAEIRAAFKMMQ